MYPAHDETPPGSPAEIARVALHSLTEQGLPPTPENYARFYYQISGEPPPSPEPASAELVELVRALLGTVTDKTSSLAASLSVHGSEIKQSIDNLHCVREKHQVMDLLSAVVASAGRIHASVESTHEELVETRKSLEQMRSELEENRRLLHEDSLTGAQNRRGMDATLAREVAKAKRFGTKLTAAMIDLDHFKDVNDRYGHEAGDELLLHLSTVARSVLRESDVLVRYGGEEFLLILPEACIQGAQFVLDRLQQLVQRSPLIFQGKKIEITFSGGVAQLRPEENGHALIRRADAALYQAKRAGRNCIRIAAD